jgi:hypothetical protein
LLTGRDVNSIGRDAEDLITSPTIFGVGVSNLNSSRLKDYFGDTKVQLGKDTLSLDAAYDMAMQKDENGNTRYTIKYEEGKRPTLIENPDFGKGSNNDSGEGVLKAPKKDSPVPTRETKTIADSPVLREPSGDSPVVRGPTEGLSVPYVPGQQPVTPAGMELGPTLEEAALANEKMKMKELISQAKTGIPTSKATIAAKEALKDIRQRNVNAFDSKYKGVSKYIYN